MNLSDCEPSKEQIIYLSKEGDRTFWQRIKSIIGIMNHMPNMTTMSTLFIIYQCLKKNELAIANFIIMNLYLRLFSKKSELYLKILKWLSPASYFRSFKLVIQEPLMQEGCLFTIHPHNIFCFGIQLCVANSDTPLANFEHITASAALNLAPHGFAASWQGYTKADAKNLFELMDKRKNIVLQPGGFKESVISNHKESRMIIYKRKGFIKLALKYGYAICPGYIFQEQKAYYCSDAMQNFRLKFSKYQIPSALFMSQYGPFPNPNIDITVVIGKPIQFPKINKPTKEQVQSFHQQYINALIDLYNNNVEKYDPGTKLTIVDKPKL